VLVFHILARDDWDAALERGTYAPPSLAEEGFVHFSFAEQVESTADARFGERDGLCVVEFDSTLIPAELRVEDSYGTGTKFPHAYGPIPVGAAVAVHELTRDGAGSHRFSHPSVTSPGGGASPGR
jgi:uncharacterized protein (DUF952 family)